MTADDMMEDDDPIEVDVDLFYRTSDDMPECLKGILEAVDPGGFCVGVTQQTGGETCRVYLLPSFDAHEYEDLLPEDEVSDRAVATGEGATFEAAVSDMAAHAERWFTRAADAMRAAKGGA